MVRWLVSGHAWREENLPGENERRAFYEWFGILAERGGVDILVQTVSYWWLALVPCSMIEDLNEAHHNCKQTPSKMISR